MPLASPSYGEDAPGVLMCYDGGYWQYALGSDSAVLLRGTRRRTDENRDEPIKDLFHRLCRSGLKQMRAAWGFTL